jgi:two-component system chemotaxis response regulator CheB
MEKSQVTPAFKVLILGGSAGSLEVMLSMLPRLQELPNHALVIVLHRKTSEDTTLEELLALKSAIPFREVEDKTLLMPGYLHVAPSGYHLLFEKNGELSLDASEKINYSRPSIDVAFESAAEAYGAKVTAVLLSGANADGALGMKAVQQAGGITIAQDPAGAEMPFMPRSAIENASAQHVLSVPKILEFIHSLTAL